MTCDEIACEASLSARDEFQPVTTRPTRSRDEVEAQPRDQCVAGRPGLKVLIVEDEAIIAMGLELMVESLGHNVVATAGTEADAIRLSRSKLPQVVLMDVKLGRGGNGVSAAQAIAARQTAAIVFCTAYSTDPATLAAMRSVNPLSILTKPIRRADLKSIFDLVQ